MNIATWILQALLALLYFAGGAYKIFSFDEMAKMPQTAALPHGVWTVLGVFEIVGAFLLIVPAATKKKPILTPIAAAALALESLALAALFASYSTQIVATNPFPWNLAMGLLAAFVAYARFVRQPAAL